ncbi:hypothetical protein R6G85_03175 [Actinotignum urinale]|uniref:Uncharacterized protein n=1 Tax=Actinotignum urinale TaxID=190146 RepID=A0AAW9HYC8_9ACTO|nr:hypothetical protein [Actinotignum urinale]MDY5129197.1 hypothetical protein [Actinotignum urinale]MDY5132384.1 hypothetical protein [Actinotignum urinale]MDY5151491.1 hypothetical protein [Actinotignum urinale]MDY5155014.1 hypothetical protein [Actinotignum urinale]
MLLIIIASLAILGSVIGVYGLIFVRRNGKDAKEWVSESYIQWKEDGLDVDGYEVVVHDTPLRDVFDAFPSVSEAYVSPEDVEERFGLVRESEREITAQVKKSTDKIRARIVPAKKNSAGEPEDTATDTPVDASADTSADTPADAPVNASADTPADNKESSTKSRSKKRKKSKKLSKAKKTVASGSVVEKTETTSSEKVNETDTLSDEEGAEQSSPFSTPIQFPDRKTA